MATEKRLGQKMRRRKEQIDGFHIGSVSSRAVFVYLFICLATFPTQFGEASGVDYCPLRKYFPKCIIWKLDKSETI